MSPSFVGFLALLAVAVALPGLLSAQTWERLGPAGGEVVSLAAAKDGTVYLGTPDGHVFTSTDRGEHWELRGRAGGRLDGVVKRIVPDSASAERVLAALWFRGVSGGGVFESVDGGRHWRLTGLGDEAVRVLEQSPSEQHTWFAGTRRGVFRSTDDGHSWQRITPADDPELQNVDSLAVDPRDPQIIYVGTYHLPWKSVDGGKSWNSISAGMIDDSDVMSLRVDAQNPKRLFSSACSGIYRSDDAGATWTKLQGIPYSSRRTQQIVQDPRNPHIIYAATTEGLWITVDSGDNWKRITAREADASAVVVLPMDKGERVLAGFAAQGVLASDDGGNSFAPSNEGFSHRVILALAADPGDSRHLLARVEGFAGMLLETRDAGKSWSELPGGLPSKTVERIFGTASGWWVSLAQGGLARFDGAAGKWQELAFREAIATRSPAARTRNHARVGERLRTVFPHVAALVEQETGIFAACDDGLWKKGEGQMEFRRIPAKNLPKPMVSLTVTLDHMLLAISGNTLWLSDAQYTTWTRLPSPKNAGALLWEKDYVDRGLEIRLLGSQHGVFDLVAGGDWRLESRGLPAIASEAPAFVGRDVLIGMSNGGFYESSDGLSSWQRLDEDREQGPAAAILDERDGAFLVGSRSEGLLRVGIGKDPQ